MGQDVKFEDRKFDWRPRYDTRSLNFLIQDNFGTGTPPKSKIRRQWGVYLDQGVEGACTGFGTAKALLQTPRRRKDVTNDFARTIYTVARREDEWPGENYDGSSVLGAMRAAQSMGFIKEYYWARTLKEIQHAVGSERGSIVFGCNWYEDMANVDNKGFLRVSGQIVGGHAICIGGIDLERKAFVMNNSWGKYWGGNGAPPGSAFIRFEDVDRLLHEQGEAALMRKV
jgi:hypothetical protein